MEHKEAADKESTGLDKEDNFFAPLNRKNWESVLPSPGPPMPAPAPAMPTAGHKEAADKESTGLDMEATELRIFPFFLSTCRIEKSTNLSCKTTSGW